MDGWIGEGYDNWWYLFLDGKGLWGYGYEGGATFWGMLARAANGCWGRILGPSWYVNLAACRSAGRIRTLP